MFHVIAKNRKGKERIAWKTYDKRRAEKIAKSFTHEMECLREETGDSRYNTTYFVRDAE